MKTTKTNTVSALALAVSLALASGQVLAQAAPPPPGDPCLVATQFGPIFAQGDGSAPPATVESGGVALGCGSLSIAGSTAIGGFTFAEFGSTAIGESAAASGFSTSIGIQSQAGMGAPAGQNYAAVAVGFQASANARSAVAVGPSSTASADNATALGFGSNASAFGSVALGDNSLADRERTVSVGHAGNERQLVNVAAGVFATDAVNVAQLSPYASALGGGSLFSSGIFIPPSYVFASGATFTNVGSALLDLDGRLSGLESGGGGQPIPGPQGPQGPTGPAGADGAADTLAIRYDDETRDTATLVGENGTRIGNVADGVAGTDAVTLRQMRDADAILSTRIDTLGDRVGGLENRIAGLDRRIAKVGALGAATGLMAAASAGNTDQWRVGAAVANYDGEEAVAIGLTGGWRLRNGRPIGFVFGGSSAGGDAAVGLGFSVGLGSR